MRLKRKRSKIPVQVKLAVPLVFLLAVVWVWKSTVATNLSRQLTQLERAKTNMTEENKRLLADLEKCRSIGWVDSRIRLVCDMTYDIKNRQIIYENRESKSRQSQNKGLYAGMFQSVLNLFRGAQ